MTRRLGRRALLASLAAMAGCASGDPPTSPATTGSRDERQGMRPSPGGASRPPETPTRTPDAIEPREWPEGYYQGPLFSAHEHLSARGFSVRSDFGWFVRWMDRNRVDRAIAFAPDNFMTIISDFGDRFLPFAFGYRQMREEYNDLRGAFEERLDRWPYVGIGELGFKGSVTPPDEPPPQPDDPEALEMWDLAAERGLPVMVHASEPWRYPEHIRERWDDVSDWPTKAHLANAMAYNRETQFLVHATYWWHDIPNGEIVADALDNNPNLTYDISMLQPLGYSEGALTEAQFAERIEEMGGVERIAERFYDEYEAILEGYSDRVTWGMDTSWEWHYTDGVLDTWVDLARVLLGRLPEENARNIGYRTVSDLMDVEVEPA